MAKKKNERIVIPFSDTLNLVAEKLKDPDYPCELAVFFEDKSGVCVQDLVVVQQTYSYPEDADGPVFSESSVNVLLYADEESEDCTSKEEIKIRRDA